MRLATLRRGGGTFAARIDSDTQATVIDGYSDLSRLLDDRDWKSVAAQATGATIDLRTADYAPVVPNPGKIICVGLNYATHIAEMGRDLPAYPTLFSKFKEALTGPYDDVVVPSYAAAQLDWEAELAVIIGAFAYQVDDKDADDYIAGYSVINDYTMRDYQYRSTQWDQGKTFEKTSGFGPHLVTDYVLGSRIEAKLDNGVMQSGSTDDLVFSPQYLVEYISHIVTLAPGDVIITGTTGGVGHARKPPRYIAHGETVEVTIDGLGSVRNKTIVKQD
jgi:acylpyruvate hydrolase